MGALVIGEDLLAVAAQVWREPPRGPSFGWLSAKAGQGTPLLPLREWIADHVVPPPGQPVVLAPLWSHVIAELLPVVPGPWPLVSKEVVQAVSDTLMSLASDGLSAESLRTLSQRARRERQESAELLLGLAELWQALDRRLQSAGLIARTAALNLVRPLAGDLRGIVAEFPGAIAAQTLLRAVRESERATLGLLYAPDGSPAFAAGQLFLDAAAPEHFSLHEEEAPALAVGDCPPLLNLEAPLLDRAYAALATKQVDVVVADPAVFSTLAELAAGGLGAGPLARFAPASAIVDPTLRWSLQPLDRTAALDWVRAQSRLLLGEERRLLASANPLSQAMLPRQLGELLAKAPSTACSAADYAGWISSFATLPATLAEQATRLGWQLPIAAWGRLLLEHQQSEAAAVAVGGAGAALLAPPWLPSGERPVLWLGREARSQRRKLLAPKTEQWLARLGLKSFAARLSLLPSALTAATVDDQRSVHRLPAQRPAAPRPLPTEAVAPPPTRVTVSELIDYIHCPQRYFLRHFLPSERPPQAELSPADIGSLAHRSAEQVLRPLVGVSLSAARIDEALAQVESVVSEQQLRWRAALGVGALDHMRLTTIARQLGEFLRRDLERLLARSGRIAGLEWAIEVELEGLKVRGRIDRVDRVETAEGSRYWLWDLKSGHSLPALREPQALQLLLYGQALGWDQVDAVGFVSLANGEMIGMSRDPELRGIKAVSDLSSRWDSERQWLQSARLGLLAADYEPRPFAGNETCSLCSVRALCRYTSETPAGGDEADDAA